MYLSVVPPPLVSLLWPKCLPHIIRALNEGAGEFTVGDIRERVDNGTLTLWALINTENIRDVWDVQGAGVTELANYPRLKVCNILLWAADPNLRDTWLPKLEQVEKWAWEMGCDVIRPLGRMGWSVVLRDYRRVGVVYEKDLRHELGWRQQSA